MKRLIMAVMGALALVAGAETNLVPEGKRNLDVPFKGEGKMGMHFIPVFFPRGTKGAAISFEAKITDVQKGVQGWFDARMMTKFIDSQCKEVKGGPNIGGWAGTKDWFEVKKTVEVPEKAQGIALMPCLFNVKKGAFQIRKLSVVAQKTFTEDPAEKAKREADAAKKSANWEKRKAKAKERVANGGSLIPAQNGPYAKLVSKEPGKLVNAYKEYDVPADVEALKMTWKWEVKNLKTGEKPWFDARVLFKFKDANGKEVQNPGPVYVQKDTKGWQDRETSFLVPKEAVTLVVMPCLFQVKAGEMEMTDVRCVASSAEPLKKAAAERERQAKARYVPDEPENRAKWPKMVRVQGNRLVDPSGKEVWLQGVNAGGMETIPNGEQETKSTVVAIDEWKANCIRLPINEAHWFGTGVYSKNDGGKSFRDACDKIVRLAANRGAYVVIDLHRFRAPKAEHVAFWKDCAAHYKDHPAVLFDLFNEPHGISWEVWRDGGWVGQQGKHDESACAVSFRFGGKKRELSPFDGDYPRGYGYGMAMEGSCGCVRACMVHLERAGKLKCEFREPFRPEGWEQWTIDHSQHPDLEDWVKKDYAGRIEEHDAYSNYNKKFNYGSAKSAGLTDEPQPAEPAKKDGYNPLID